MASENETVAEIANVTRFAIDYGNGVSLDLDGKQVIGILDRIEAAHKREMADFEATKRALANVIAEKKQFAEIAAKKEREVAELRKQTRNCDGDRADWKWYWGRYVTTQVCPCERKTATPEKHLRYFLNWLFLPKWVTGNDRDGEGSGK